MYVKEKKDWCIKESYRIENELWISLIGRTLRPKALQAEKSRWQKVVYLTEERKDWSHNIIQYYKESIESEIW